MTKISPYTWMLGFAVAVLFVGALTMAQNPVTGGVFLSTGVVFLAIAIAQRAKSRAKAYKSE